MQDNDMRGNRIFKFLDYYCGTLILWMLWLLGFKKKNAIPANINRVVVIKLAAMGDTLLLIPLLRSLKHQYPNGKLLFVGSPINEELLGLYPHYIDQILSINVSKIAFDPCYFLRIVHQLRAFHADLVIDGEQWSFISSILSAISGASITIGFKIPKRFRHILYSSPVERQRSVHEIDNFIRLLSIGLDIETERKLELPVSDKACAEAKEILRMQGWNDSIPIVLIHPGCGSHGFPREWPIDYYEQLCKRLSSNYNLWFIFTGYGDEVRLTDQLAKVVTTYSSIVTNVPLPLLVAFLTLSNVVISGNNGVMHLAAALQKPQVALHGPTNSVQWGPINPNAVVIRTSCPQCPCLDLGFEYHRTDGYCMAQIPVEVVYDAVIHCLDVAKR